MKKTARAHTNIALIKYWGKANQALKTPLMSSLSMTLDAFYTDTTFEHDSSSTSIALSGRLRSVMYRSDIETAASSASSLISTL